VGFGNATRPRAAMQNRALRAHPAYTGSSFANSSDDIIDADYSILGCIDFNNLMKKKL
jgi:hypothetical protein